MNTHSYEVEPGVIHTHNVTDLWKHTVDTAVTKLALAEVIKTFNAFINDFDHTDWARVINADITYPIIFNHRYGVVDGCHRAVKLLLLGYDQVEVKVIENYPTPSHIYSSWSNFEQGIETC